jgi:Tfp pilus assembly protein FimT
MLELICTVAVAVLALCAYAAFRSALRRRRAPAAARAAADPYERVLSLVRSGRRLAAVREAQELTGGDVAAAVALVERLDSGSGR